MPVQQGSQGAGAGPSGGEGPTQKGQKAAGKGGAGGAAGREGTPQPQAPETIAGSPADLDQRALDKLKKLGQAAGKAGKGTGGEIYVKLGLVEKDLRAFARRVVRHISKEREVYQSDMPSRKLKGQFGRDVEVEGGRARVLFLLDTSGSVYGHINELAEFILALVRDGLRILRSKGLSLNVILGAFAGRGAFEELPRVSSPSQVRQVLERVAHKVGTGGTEIRKVLELPELAKSLRRDPPDACVIASDFEIYDFEPQDVSRNRTLASCRRRRALYAIVTPGALEKALEWVSSITYIAAIEE